MKLYFYFACESWRTPQHPRHLMYGRYSRVGFAFTDEDSLVMYGTTQGGVFSEIKNDTQASLDLLMPNLDTETTDKIRRTCEACAKCKIKFNLQDLLLLFAPFYMPDEIPLFECKTLNNQQAFILILRECLPKEHELMHALANLSSRQSLVETIYDTLAPYAPPIFQSQLVHKNGIHADRGH